MTEDATTSEPQLPSNLPTRVRSLIEGLDESKLELLGRMAEALSVPVQIERTESDLVDDTFSQVLGNFLLLHHAIHEEPLNKAAFEYVMKGCAIAGGKSASLNPGRGPATWDLEIDSERWSLKTEAAKGMSRSTFKIEKFMEARWIRECTNPAKCSAAAGREIPKHMNGYSRILGLRAFQLKDGRIQYDLIEPPASILRARLSDLPIDAFTKEGRKESYGANIETTEGERIFRILLDSSVEKVRLWFNVNQCRNHGSWTLKPTSVQEAAIS